MDFSSKHSLKPLKKEYLKSTIIKYDTLGRVIQYYNIDKIRNGTIDTSVVWLYYEKEQLTNRKSTFNNRIKVETFYYENGESSAKITGFSKNESNSKLNLNISNYVEGASEFYSHYFLENGDTLTKVKSINDVIFRKETISWIDTNTKMESISFLYAPEKAETTQYIYSKNLLTKLIKTKGNKITSSYIFHYNKNRDVSNYSKFDPDGNEVEFTKFIYSNDLNTLQAIITKNISTSKLEIKKITYTYKK